MTNDYIKVVCTIISCDSEAQMAVAHNMIENYKRLQQLINKRMLIDGMFKQSLVRSNDTKEKVDELFYFHKVKFAEISS